MIEQRLCKCNCGTPVKASYVTGHNPPGISVRYSIEDRGYKTACHVWQGGLNKWGYAKVKRNGKTLAGHRWFYQQTGKLIPEGMDLDHLCRVRDCVNPEHLEPVLPIENKRRGLVAKLSKEDVASIELRYKNGESQYQLAREFGVRQPCISRLLAGLRWSGIALGIEARNPTKLIPEQVQEIRRRAQHGEVQRDIARAFGMGQAQISRIVRGESWSFVGAEV